MKHESITKITISSLETLRTGRQIGLCFRRPFVGHGCALLLLIGSPHRPSPPEKYCQCPQDRHHEQKAEQTIQPAVEALFLLSRGANRLSSSLRILAGRDRLEEKQYWRD